MNKTVYVFNHEIFAGTLTKKDAGYYFKYDSCYLKREEKSPISLTLPLRDEEYYSERLFPFFDGLIVEGFLHELAVKNWKLNRNDRFELLLKTGKHVIGSVSIRSSKDE